MNDAPLGGPMPLIDAHAHFYHAGAGRSDWERVNAARFRAGDAIGITYHVASVLGSYGHTSPTYFPSPTDVTAGNDAMRHIAGEEAERVRWFVTVNPNHAAHALGEIERGMADGAIGVKLLASRRADHPLLDPICEIAAERHLPILHHIWQHRTREWPNQEISDGSDLARLAERHPRANFILAHIGGGGDWAHTLPAVRDSANIYPDLSGSGVDRGMLDAALYTLGAQRLLWACDLTMETGLAKLRALNVIGLSDDDLADVRWRNAARLFPPGLFPEVRRMIDVAAFIGPYPFRELPHPEPGVLTRVLQREGLSGAWVGYLPSPWQRDPAPGNDALFHAIEAHPTLHAAPVVRPDWPGWRAMLDELVDRGAAAIRAYPMHWAMGPHSSALRDLAVACAGVGIPLLLTVRFEDLRQRSALDNAGDLTAAHIRALARIEAPLKLVVTGAGREVLEETHWGLTPAEQQRVHWDFAWIWGPPEDHLAHLFRTIGPERFVYGTHWPLRLTQNPRANLDLLPGDLRGRGITDAAGLAPSVGKTPT